MKTYLITYKDCGETDTWRIKGGDAEHAEERFWDRIEDWQGDHRGIELVSIRRVKN